MTECIPIRAVMKGSLIELLDGLVTTRRVAILEEAPVGVVTSSLSAGRWILIPG